MSNSMNAFEMSEAELAQVHGGGWLSDAWNSVKKGVKEYAKAVGEGFANAAKRTVKETIGRFLPF